ncbi:MAG: hypothetical protein COX19_04465 [Desulfobacterales bacterium CG23_combo_of_CG06-09_8_20_14_all_51_8]|nr:MAG: hypothetical protein COX19_04465 [Desulfobacterales bacterium CG23_combo_of_CG06-09_8_20_14_all_51_8]
MFFHIDSVILLCMPSTKPRLIMVLEQKLIDKVDQFQAVNNLASRSEAVRHLIIKALKGEITGPDSEVLKEIEALKSHMEILEKDMDEIAKKTNYYKRQARQKQQVKQTVSAGNDEDKPLHHSIIINK